MYIWHCGHFVCCLVFDWECEKKIIVSLSKKYWWLVNLLPLVHSYIKSTYANYRTVVIDVSVIYNTIHSLKKRTRAGLHKHLFKVCAC